MTEVIIKDTVLYKDKEQRVMEDYEGELYLQVYGEGRVYLSNIEDQYSLVRKYVPSMEYAGASADILGYIKDQDSRIIYLELFGQEDYVKSITSVIMQGRIKMNDHWLSFSEGYFDVHKAGNKRLIEILDEGYVSAIVYHSPSIKDANFSAVIAEDEDRLLGSFSNWMEQTNKMPYPKETLPEIYAKMQERELLKELDGFGVAGVTISDDIGLNEFELMQEIVLEVGREKGIFGDKAASAGASEFAYPMPRSPMLTPEQVKHIYRVLETMPKTYTTDEWAYKPVGVKLFGGSATIYVTECDKSAGTVVDGETQGHIQCFGYADLGYGGEWGYLNFDEYIEAGLEMDLHFEERYLDANGNVFTLDELEALASKSGIGVDALIRSGERIAA